MITIVTIVLALSATPADDMEGDGTVYRKFDYALLGKIHAEHVAAKEAKRRYDPVTWLPVEDEKPAPRQKSARSAIVEQERRAARVRLVVLRKQQRRQRSAGYDPLWWINMPAVPTKPCAWAMMSYAASMSRR